VQGGLFDNPGSHRVEMDIRGELLRITISIDRNGFVAALKQVAGPLAFHAEARRMGSVHMFHDLRQISVRGLRQEMVVIGHEAINMNPCTIADGC